MHIQCGEGCLIGCHTAVPDYSVDPYLMAFSFISGVPFAAAALIELQIHWHFFR